MPSKKHRSRVNEPRGRTQGTNRPLPCGHASELLGTFALVVCYPHPGRIGDFLWGVKRHLLACKRIDGQLRTAYEVWGLPEALDAFVNGGMVAEWHLALAGRINQVSVGMGAEKLNPAPPVWQERLLAEPAYTNDEVGKEKLPKITLCKEWAGKGYVYHWLRVTPRKGREALQERSQTFQCKEMAKGWLKQGKCVWRDADSYALPPEVQANPLSNGDGWVGK